MKILVFTSDYPSNKSPNRGVFVYQLVQKFASLGHQVSVIAPRAMNKRRPGSEVSSYGEENAKVYRPGTLTFSAVKIGSFNSYQIGEYVTIKAVKDTVRKHNIQFDLVYAHFLTNGLIATRALKAFHKPIFIAMGESNLDSRLALVSRKKLYENLPHVTGFVMVAEHLRQKLMTLGVAEDRIKVFPNAVDLKKFKPMDRAAMRRKLGLREEDKILIFVGRIVAHKGPDRLVEALQRIQKDIKLILIGRGDMELHYDGIIFRGAIPSHEVPLYLNAADIFVLPTQREGASNAIVEAMACGLPIISSNIPEVKEQCTPAFSKLVDPMSVDELEKAIIALVEDEEGCREMSLQAIQHSANFDINKRAEAIEAFFYEMAGDLKEKV